MSRLTASQVIALGEYLGPDFNPSVLTVSQLLGVLGFHNISYPTPYTKPRLVQLFNDEIKSKAPRLRRERLRKESSQASDDGITDGVTGRPIGGPQRVAPPRRSSRRISHALSDEGDTSPARPDPPKRRRSSAQPILGGPSRTKIAAAQPALAEESEPEEELPIRKVGRSKKTSEAAGSQGRRVSAADDSGWEDNNIFQSGAESSSPLRPSPIRQKTARKSTAPRKSRKSASAPPQMFPSSPPKYNPLSDSPHSPPQSRFEPQLPLSVAREKRTLGTDAKGMLFSPGLSLKGESEDDELNLVDGDGGVGETLQEVPEGDEDEAKGEDEEEDFDVAVSRRIADGGKSVARRAPESKPMPLIQRILLTLLAITISSAVVNYKMESASIGYCDMDSNTNSVLEELKDRRSAVEACNRENRTLLYHPPLSMHASKEGEAADATPCPPPPLLPFLHPTSCTPCPEHATCTQWDVKCNTGYLLRPHPLVFFLPPSPSPSTTTLFPPTFTSSSELIWKLASAATDGLPGLGPVGLPPRCVEDPQRKRNIGVLGKTMEAMLGQERGRRLCLGKVGHIEDGDGGEARMWGVELGKLKQAMKKKAPAHLLATFEDTFSEAMQQLIQWGGVVINEDAGGYRYVAHKTPNLTWNCAVTVKAREVWAEWRMTVFSAIMVILTGLVGRARRRQSQKEHKRVAELVQVTLDTLRNQEFAHHTDPITAAQPYLSSVQLRDLILQDEHSIPTRQRLWGRVEAVVEGNANVRANLEEVRGGDEMRVWRWIGGGRVTGL